MKIIGITGGTGAGKSTVCDELKKHGAEIVDCDVIARQVVEKGQPALTEIAEVFGKEMLLPDGSLDRKKMGALVFSNKGELDKLNGITHRYIFDEMRRIMSVSLSDVVVLDVPLLFQSDFPFNCDLTIAIVADEETRMNRIMARDGISREMAEARIANQLSNDEYANLADVCFVNDGNIQRIEEFVNRLLVEV